jgi:hypothetical protein
MTVKNDKIKPDDIKIFSQTYAYAGGKNLFPDLEALGFVRLSARVPHIPRSHSKILDRGYITYEWHKFPDYSKDDYFRIERTDKLDIPVYKDSFIDFVDMFNNMKVGIPIQLRLQAERDKTGFNYEYYYTSPLPPIESILKEGLANMGISHLFNYRYCGTNQVQGDAYRKIGDKK